MAAGEMGNDTALPALPDLMGLWRGRNTYLILDVSESPPREYPIIIPGIELLDASELEEILIWQRERTEKEILAKRANRRPKLAKQQQNDLGRTLLEVRASKRFKRENNHTRYW